MRVSVIIPAVNEEASIGRAIDTAWVAGADEVIVVDGGSEDQTRQRAGRRRCLLLSSERGRGVQQNIGACGASGDVLLFQHADTWLAENAVGQVRTALSGTAVLAGAFQQVIDAAGVAYRALEWGNAARVRWLGLAYGDQGIFVRRQTFHELGGFTEVPLLEDVILMRKLARRARPHLLPGPIHVSARRWRKRVLRQTLRNWALLAAFGAGVAPATLARYYRPHDAARRARQPIERASGNKP